MLSLKNTFKLIHGSKSIIYRSKSIINNPNFKVYNIEKIKPYIMNKEKLKFYMPNYPSTDDCCKHNPCGYIVITNANIDLYNNLQEINI